MRFRHRFARIVQILLQLVLRPQQVAHPSIQLRSLRCGARIVQTPGRPEKLIVARLQPHRYAAHVLRRAGERRGTSLLVGRKLRVVHWSERAETHLGRKTATRNIPHHFLYMNENEILLR